MTDAAATALPRRRIGLLMYDDVELLDHAGPYEVFTTAQRMTTRPDVQPPAACGFEVVSLAVEARPVRARAGLQLLPDATLAAAPPLDVLIVPGGVVDRVRADPVVRDWLRRTAPGLALLASVCTGVFVLADAGLLAAGTRCTTHWEDLADLRREHPALDVLGDTTGGPRWVAAQTADGTPLRTSAGIAAGIDLALHLVATFAGPALARRTARQMDVPWCEDPGA
jgi:transcriptional regulator GlxA family with amidase domain